MKTFSKAKDEAIRKNIEHILRHGDSDTRHILSVSSSIWLAWGQLREAARAARRSPIFKDTPGKQLKSLAKEMDVIVKKVLTEKTREYARSAQRRKSHAERLST